MTPPSPTSGEDVAQRATEIEGTRADAHARRTDRLFAWLLLGQWGASILLAATVAPAAWHGRSSTIEHVLVALLGGGLITAVPVALTRRAPGTATTRYVIAVAQMLWSALLIHLTGGRIETHFHVFGSLALLAFYRDWRVLALATGVALADNVVRQALWPESVYGVLAPPPWRFLERTFWLGFEDAFLVLSCVTVVREMRLLAEQHAQREHNDEAQGELDVATRLQTAVLPREFNIAGLQIAASMLPATEVGGDYYDVVPAADGCWIGIGDVSGHGLKAGLVMLQAQSSVKALVLQRGPGGAPPSAGMSPSAGAGGAPVPEGAPQRGPKDILADVNRVIYDNVRRSPEMAAHMTLSLMRYYRGGRVVVAGAHQDLILVRAATQRCELIRTKGTWIGMVEDISGENEELTLQLANGDTLVAYTDGLIEAGAEGPSGPFGIERVCATLEAAIEKNPETIRERLFEAVARWSKVQADDITILVIRRRDGHQPVRSNPMLRRSMIGRQSVAN